MLSGAGTSADRSAFTVPHQIGIAAGNSPNTPVVVHSDSRPDEMTIGSLYAESMCMADGLRGLGVNPGEVVAVQLPNSRECFVVHAAAWLCGAVLLPIVPIYGRREVEFILRQSGARAFVAARSVRGRDNSALLDALAEVPGLNHRIVVGEPPRDTIPYA
jgi:acyl-CoA synthetase (AMP-forming)/AMP-acid ligase II